MEKTIIKFDDIEIPPPPPKKKKITNIKDLFR